MTTDIDIDPRRDLLLERVVAVPVELVWRAWTEPELVKRWFAPKPWTTTECAFDLRPGGRAYTVMHSPEGQDYPNEGCFLEVVPNRRLVWTAALGPGFRPLAGELPFTAFILMEPSGKGTRYRAIARHGDPDIAQKHEAMGFTTGWGTCLSQLVEEMRKLM
jgi:uncharacterized protein YndB with AHSA1/START domain